jgi:hypothetical protein
MTERACTCTPDTIDRLRLDAAATGLPVSSQVGRQVYSEGYPATPEPDQADGIARAKARALSPAAQQRLRESRARRFR